MKTLRLNLCSMPIIRAAAYILWAADDFDNGNTGENYIWGGTSFNTGIILTVITSN